MAPHETKRKVRPKPAAYKPRAQKPKVKVDAPKTSAQTAAWTGRKNLTYFDWLTVFKYCDDHPELGQNDIDAHFTNKNRPGGALNVSQPSLSRNLKRRHELEARAEATPSGLDSKRPFVVTNPLVNDALYLWTQSMNNKGETVSGPMLQAKREIFEDRFDVPEEERLASSKSWIGPFCQQYKIKKIRRHGEAGSVDPKTGSTLTRQASLHLLHQTEDWLQAAERQEEIQIQNHRWVSLQPNRGKFKPIFIGRFKAPRAFKAAGKKTPGDWGFDYHNNNKAWMTKALFEPWLRSLDIQMGAQGRKVILDWSSLHRTSHRTFSR